MSIGRPQLLIDISQLIENNEINDSILFTLVSSATLNYRIEPIYYNKSKRKFYYARKFTLAFLDFPSTLLEDTIIDIHEDDIFLSLYSYNDIATECQTFYEKWKAKGIKIFLCINKKTIHFYNLLLEVCDNCICFTNSDTTFLIKYLEKTRLKRVNFKIINLESFFSDSLATYIETLDKDNFEFSYHRTNTNNINYIQSLNKKIYINNKLYSIEGDVSYLSRIGPHFDQNLISVFKTFCKKDSYVLDLGANIGLTAIALADICKKGEIIAIETLPQTFEFLKSNIRKANLNNIDLYNFAVGNKKTKINMQAKNNFLAGSFIADRYKAGQTHFTTKVNIYLIDNVFDKFNLKKIDFIKLDLEGYEILALEGAKETLSKYQPIVCLEMNHWCLNVFQRICLPEFQERLIKLFPYIYAIEHPTFLDFTKSNDFYHIAHEHITTTSKYFTLIAGFDKEMLISKLENLSVTQKLYSTDY